MTSRPESLHPQRQINDGRRDDRVNGSQLTGYISDEIISPVSLLRSDRFVRKGLLSSPPGQGQLREPAYFRPATASFTNANNRARYRREQQRLLSDVNDTLQQSRPCTAPQTVMSKAKSSDMIQKDATNMPASRSRSSDGSKDRHTIDRGQPSENFETRIQHPELGKTRMTDGAFKEDQDRSGQTRGISTSRKIPFDEAQSSDDSGIQINHPQVEKASMVHEDITTNKDGSAETKGISTSRNISGKQLINTMSQPISRAEPQRALLSQSPIRASSSSSRCSQFQPSPLKSRPLTATMRRPLKINTESSYLDTQLHERFRAFEAAQKVCTSGRQISISPLMNRQGSASEDWAKGYKLPDPCLVREPRLSAEFLNLTLKSS